MSNLRTVLVFAPFLLYVAIFRACPPEGDVTPSPPQCFPQRVSNADPPCRGGDPLANVLVPSSLRVKEQCKTVEGFVVGVSPQQDDGDYHINIKLDPEYTSLLNDGNREAQFGTLVVEIVPADQSNCLAETPPKNTDGVQTLALGCCTGAQLRRPNLGDHIRITGPLVVDFGPHGPADTFVGAAVGASGALPPWVEIHPVWAWTNTAVAKRTEGGSCEPPWVLCDDNLVCHNGVCEQPAAPAAPCLPPCSSDQSGNCICPPPPCGWPCSTDQSGKCICPQP